LQALALGFILWASLNNKILRMLQQILSSSRATKRFISITYDTFAFFFAYISSIGLRMGEFSSPSPAELEAVAITSFLSILILIKLGLYRAVLRFIGREAIMRIFAGTALSGAILAISCLLLDSHTPRSVPIIYCMVTLFLIGFPRLALRSILQISDNQKKTTVLIYGAGEAGRLLGVQLNLGSLFHVIGYVDDDSKLKGSTINGAPIYASKEIEDLIHKFGVQRILLAIGNSTRQQRKSIIERLEPLPTRIQTIPPISDILSGKSTVNDVRDVDIADLLGREQIPAKPELLEKCIANKVVMVTGAGGSIGAELCRQILAARPKTIVLYELNEFSLYSIEKELLENLGKRNIKVVPILGSVQHKERLELIMTTYGVQTVYHAAAYKHVPLVEHNIVEGVRNNVFGTLSCAQAAIKTGAENFILVSTDKAVRPTNIMGASKRLAELCLQALQTKAINTRFTMVRFGNVLGSSGSVVPLFRDQIDKGGPITVTHPDIIRYFMTIPEAAGLVIQAGSMAKGGEVFVLDMGEPVKILDLAKRIIHLSGLTEKNGVNTNGDIEITFTGLRPGEKLYEELLIGDDVKGTEHTRIMVAEEAYLSWAETEQLIEKLDKACSQFNCEDIQKLLITAPTGFNPDHKIEDALWKENSNQESSAILN